jgi:drug/metabolite transporter (DMT)-like permease
MTFLIILLMCALASAKVTLQSSYSRGKNSSEAQKHLFNAILFGTITLMFLPTLFDGAIHPYTLAFGAVVGALSVLFQFSYLKAFSTGRVTLTVIVNNFSMLIPMVYSIIFLGEGFGYIKLIATLLAAVSFFLVVKRDKNEKDIDGKVKIKWLIYTMILFLSGGVCTAVQKTYAVKIEEIQVFEFVAIAYFCAMLLSLALFGVERVAHRNQQVEASGKMVLFAVLVGLSLGVFQCVNTYAPSIIDGTVLYPAYNSGVSVLIAIVGAIVFKERLTVKQYIGSAIGILAVILLCV